MIISYKCPDCCDMEMAHAFSTVLQLAQAKIDDCTAGEETQAKRKTALGLLQVKG